MENKDFLKILNIRDKRIELEQKITSEKFDNKIINIIKGKLTYKVKKCPHCKKEKLLKNGFDTIKLQIQNIGDRKTYLILDKQRYICKECRKSFTVNSREHKKHCRKSYTINQNVTYYLTNSKFSQTDIAKILNISVSTTNKQLKKYTKEIKVNKNRLPKILCIDELNGVGTYQGKYNCVIYDVENKKIKDVLITRRKNYLEKYINTYTKEAKEQVKYFITDMYSGYIKLSEKYFKNAKIVIDRFHIVNLIIRTLDNIRINLMNKYAKSSFEYRVLKRFNKLIKKRYSQINYNYKKYTYYRQFQNEYDVINYILGLSKELEQAYYLLQIIFLAIDKNDIEIFYNIFKNKEEYKINDKLYTCVKTLEKYKEYIANAIIYPYSNGILEAINGQIKLLKRNAYGYRNFNNFRTRIFMIFNYIKENNIKTIKSKSKKEKKRAG